MEGTLCGVWIDGDGRARVCVATAEAADGRKGPCRSSPSRGSVGPIPSTARSPASSSSRLAGTAALGTLARAASLEAFDGFVQRARESGPSTRSGPLESQFLLQHRARLYGDMGFARLRRCQVDIETGVGRTGASATPRRPEDRVLAIGMRSGGANRLLLLEEMTRRRRRSACSCGFNARARRARSRRHRGPQHLQVRPRLPAGALPAAEGALRLGAFRPEGHLPEQPAQGRRALDRLPALRPARPRGRRHLPARAPERHLRAGAQFLRAEGGGGPLRDHRRRRAATRTYIEGQPDRRGFRERPGAVLRLPGRRPARDPGPRRPAPCRPTSSRRARSRSRSRRRRCAGRR